MSISLRFRLAATTMLAALPAAATTAPVMEAEIIVTARSLEETLPQELAAYGSDVETVTEKQIRDGGFRDVSQTLQMLTPGLHIAPRSGPFSYIDVSLQGSRTQDVLWLVDGVRINNRLYNSTTPVDTLPASMVERIEVLKGGQSLFYGTQAAAGAVNVVTRGFSDTPDGQINAGGDSRGGWHVDGYARGAMGPHKLVVYGTKDKADGYRPFSVVQPSATDTKQSYDVQSIGAKYRIDLAEDLRLDLQYQHTDATLDNIQPRVTKRSYNRRDEEIASLRLDYTPTGIAQFFLKGYFHDWDTTYANIQNNPVTGAEVVVYPPGTYWGYQDYGLNGVVKLHPHQGLDYLLGYDFQNFKGRDEVLLIDGKTEQVHAGILQIRTDDDFSKKLKLAAGLRHNISEGSETTVWTISGRYTISDALYVEGVGGTSFLLPDAEKLFGIDPCCARGNPDLEAEESRSINLSVGGLTPGLEVLSWQATFFARNVDNLITDDYSNPAFPDGIYINVDRKVTVRGGEFQLNAQLGDDWRAGASYTITRARDQGSDRQRDRTPKHFGKASVYYEPANRPLGANLALNWVGKSWQTVSGFGRQSYGDYVILDLGLHLYLDGADRRHRLGLRLENATGKEYATRLGSALIDGSSQRFLYANRGVPRTLHVNYGVSF